MNFMFIFFVVLEYDDMNCNTIFRSFYNVFLNVDYDYMK
jgi:hypothetical protein